jgi:PAS domain S-box-containing protein
MNTISSVDFKALFEKLPGLYIILNPTFTITAISDAYLSATMTQREAIIGRSMFEIFPDNPDDIEADGVLNLRASLNFVLKHKRPHAMAVQRYDIRRPDGIFEVRYWNRLNSPVFNEADELVYIIHNVVDATNYHNIEVNLKKSEKDYQLLINSVKEFAIFMTDTEGKVASWNSGAERIKGYTSAEIIGQPIRIFYTADDISLGVPEQNFQKALQYGHFETEGWRLRKDGTRFWANIVITALKDEAGILYGYSKVTLDITERKNAQEQLQFLSRLINKSNDAIFTTDADRKIRTWNAGAQKLYGFTQEEVIGNDVNEILSTAITEESIKIALNKIAQQGYWSGELQRKTKAGNNIVVWSSTTAIRENSGPITGYVGVSFDITEQKKLREQVNHLANIVEQSSEAIISRGMDQRFISWNSGAERMFGYRKEEAIGKTLMDLKFTALAEKAIADISRQIIKQGTWNSEREFFHKDGTAFFGVVQANAVKNETGEITSMVFMIKDISPQKRLEQYLKLSNEQLEKKIIARTEEISRQEKRFRALIENSNDIISLLDDSFNVIYRSPAAARITGWPDEEMIGLNGTKNIHPDDIALAKNIIADLKANPGKPINCLFRNQHKNGHYLWLEGVVTNLLTDLNISSIVFNFRDVTERIEAEEKLKSSENRFRALIENSQEVVTMMDDSFNLIYRSPAAARVTGWTNEDMLGIAASKNIHPEDQEYASLVVKEIMANPGKQIETKFRMRHKNGRYIWIEGIFKNLLHDQFIKAIVFNYRDVTQRIEAEEAIKKSNERFELAVMATNDVIWDWDIISNTFWRNKNYYSHFGYEENVIPSDPNAWHDCIYKQDKEAVLTGLHTTIKAGKPYWSAEYRYLKADKSVAFVLDCGHILYNEKGKAYRMVGAMLDITDRKLAEQERVRSKMEEQKNMTKAMLAAQEKERNYLGQELHDNINQILAGTKMFLSIAGNKNKEVGELVKYPMELLDKSIEEIRTLCHKMVTPLKDVNLEELIQDILYKFDRATKIKTSFRYSVPNGTLSDELQLNIYRIIQELFNNIHKYSAAKKVSIALIADNKNIALTVMDDGRGFNPEKKRIGIGISNVTNRVESFNGSIAIESSEGCGCKINITIPL